LENFDASFECVRNIIINCLLVNGRECSLVLSLHLWDELHRLDQFSKQLVGSSLLAIIIHHPSILSFPSPLHLLPTPNCSPPREAGVSFQLFLAV
jgi:hypothetical protein